MRSRLLLPALVVVALLAPWAARAAGTLTPLGSPDTPIVIRSHHVGVVVNNGFSRTEVIQTFYNPNPEDLEGLYAFPVPIGASLSEVTIVAGDRELHGEVVPRNEARRLYEEEKSRGHDTGLATREGYRNFEFRVSPIRARGETQLRFVYYQRIEIDTGIARYLYPLEEGGTDELAKQFWTSNDRVEGLFSAEIELKSAWAVTNLRVPGFEKEAVFEELAEGHYRIRIDRPRAKLDRDLLLYYRLADGLPGRAELVAYRAETEGPGTFMLVVTPGIDLKEITGGADTVFVLDVSAPPVISCRSTPGVTTSMKVPGPAVSAR